MDLSVRCGGVPATPARVSSRAVLALLAGLCGCGDGGPDGPTPPGPAPVAHVAVIAPSGPVGVGNTAQVGVTLTDAQENPLSDRTVTWASSNIAIATVEPSGLVSGIRKGTVTITATAEGVSGSAQVTVAYLFSLVAAGSDYTCALSTGSVGFCWGGGGRGQLGAGGTPASVRAPVPIAGGLRFATISANKSSGYGRHTCGLTTEGAVACWGDGASGQLGDGGFVMSSEPVVLSGIPLMSTVVVGNAHTCAIAAADAAAYCWGLNVNGQLGTGDTLNRGVPTPVVGGLGFRSLALGTYHTCGVSTAGDLYCWGANPDLEYGVDTTGASLVPLQVPSALKFRMAGAGDFHTCALAESGAAYCWGGNHEGQFGTGDLASSLSPVAVSGGLSFSSLGVGLWHACGTSESGKTYCWGYNRSGQIGQPPDPVCGTEPYTFPCSMTPLELAGAPAFAVTGSGVEHACGITVAGELYCWGGNFRGQLGDGTAISHSAPALVKSP